MTEDEQVAQRIARQIAEIHPPVEGRWVAERCPEWIAAIESITAAALRAQREAQWQKVLKIAQAYICDHGSKATYEALKFHRGIPEETSGYKS